MRAQGVEFELEQGCSRIMHYNPMSLTLDGYAKALTEFLRTASLHSKIRKTRSNKAAVTTMRTQWK